MVLQTHELLGDILKLQNPREMSMRKSTAQVAQGFCEVNRELNQDSTYLLSNSVSRGEKPCLRVGRRKEEGQAGEKIRTIEWNTRKDLTTILKPRPSEKELSWPACYKESQSRAETLKVQKEAYFKHLLGPSPRLTWRTTEAASLLLSADASNEYKSICIKKLACNPASLLAQWRYLSSKQELSLELY